MQMEHRGRILLCIDYLLVFLIYLTITRLKICYAVHVLSQFEYDPKQVNLDVAFQILKYLKGMSWLEYSIENKL